MLQCKAGALLVLVCEPCKKGAFDPLGCDPHAGSAGDRAGHQALQACHQCGVVGATTANDQLLEGLLKCMADALCDAMANALRREFHEAALHILGPGVGRHQLVEPSQMKHFMACAFGGRFGEIGVVQAGC